MLHTMLTFCVIRVIHETMITITTIVIKCIRSMNLFSQLQKQGVLFFEVLGDGGKVYRYETN